MRGKGVPVRAVFTCWGITPAHAGKSMKNKIIGVCPKDHPRTCGEKRRALRCEPPRLGSPPHMRGKVYDGPAHAGPVRITPAHAGKRSILRDSNAMIRDHPRTCGEKQMGGIVRLTGFRITPAHAGKRLKRSRSIVPHAAIVPLFPSVCNKPAGSDGSPAGHDAPPFLPIENAVPASPAYNLRSL